MLATIVEFYDENITGRFFCHINDIFKMQKIPAAGINKTALAVALRNKQGTLGCLVFDILAYLIPKSVRALAATEAGTGT
jgi:hypothetical protein